MERFREILPNITGDNINVLMDIISTGIIITDLEGNCVFVNKFWKDLTGFTFEEARGNGWSLALHPEDKNQLFQLWQEYISDSHSFTHTYRYLHPSGTTRWVKETASPIRSDAGIITGYLRCLQDITAMKIQEEELRSALITTAQQLQFNTKITQALPSVVWIFSLEKRRTLYITSRCADIYGIEAEEFMNIEGDLAPRMVHPEDLAQIAWNMERVMTLEDNESNESEYRLRHKQGHWIWVNSRVTVFKRDENNNPIEILGVTQDITSKREMISQLDSERTRSIYSAKMASLGEMAGGIAHEINNPLAIISGRAYQIKHAVENNMLHPQKLIELATKIEETSSRIGKIIQGLRAFSRNGDKDPFQVANLRQVVEDTLELCGKKFLQNGIDLQSSIPQEIEFESRAVQISQVILNFLNNSFDAIEALPDRWIKISARLYDNAKSSSNAPTQLEISITDSGKGIPEELRSKIMQPFFTTKRAGRGTGLGLSISREIIHDHNGEVLYDASSPHTSFLIRFPIAQPKAVSHFPARNKKAS